MDDVTRRSPAVAVSPPPAAGSGRASAARTSATAPHGVLVGLLHVTSCREGVGDHGDRVFEVVEHEHGVGEQEGHLGQAEVVGGASGRCSRWRTKS